MPVTGVTSVYERQETRESRAQIEHKISGTQSINPKTQKEIERERENWGVTKTFNIWTSQMVKIFFNFHNLPRMHSFCSGFWGVSSSLHYWKRTVAQIDWIHNLYSMCYVLYFINDFRSDENTKKSIHGQWMRLLTAGYHCHCLLVLLIHIVGLYQSTDRK